VGEQATGSAIAYVEIDRRAWRCLRENVPLTLNDDDLDRIRTLGDPIDMGEVRDIYLPLSRLVNLYVKRSGELRKEIGGFLGDQPARTPFVIGIAGGVAVGKSTTARLLRELLARWPDHRRVELVTTDGFLLPNAELARRGLLDRKGFPQSYDQRALRRFIIEVKAGSPEVPVPVYSHLSYDIVPGAAVTVRRPDILLVEGLNVLQPPRPSTRGPASLAVSDFFDFSIYVDADPIDIRRWYVERFLQLRDTAFQDPSSYFSRYASLCDEEAVAEALRIYTTINEPNLLQNIYPTMDRATVVLHKDYDHAVQRVRLRRL
jgi:type I pantothenate kinase